MAYYESQVSWAWIKHCGETKSLQPELEVPVLRGVVFKYPNQVYLEHENNTHFLIGKQFF